jgi:hypothetical protein
LGSIQEFSKKALTAEVFFQASEKYMKKERFGGGRGLPLQPDMCLSGQIEAVMP